MQVNLQVEIFLKSRVYCNDLKNFENSRPSASNFKSFSISLEQFYSQKKLPFLKMHIFPGDKTTSIHVLAIYYLSFMSYFHGLIVLSRMQQNYHISNTVLFHHLCDMLQLGIYVHLLHSYHAYCIQLRIVNIKLERVIHFVLYFCPNFRLIVEDINAMVCDVQKDGSKAF